MTRRGRDWNEGLAEDLQDPEFARQFLTAAVEEGVPLKVALAKVIRATGVKEFSESVGMPSPNVLRAINPKHNPTQETLERLLKPFPEAVRPTNRTGSDQATSERSRRVSVRPFLLCPTYRRSAARAERKRCCRPLQADVGRRQGGIRPERWRRRPHGRPALAGHGDRR
jgi:DNA-binding phage protein